MKRNQSTTRQLSRSAGASVSGESCRGEQGQPSRDAITLCIGNASRSRLESVRSGALLGKSPLLSTSFANPAVDETFEAVFNPISTE